MDEDSDAHYSFTEMLQPDDPRLKQLLDIPEEGDQSSFCATIQLVSGSDELEIEDVSVWNCCHLTNADFNRLQTIGLKGKLRAAGCGTLGDAPYKARTLLVLQQQIKEAVDLAQPDGCDVIYYQVGDEWRSFPAEVPVLKKRIRLSRVPANENLTNIWHEASFGSWAGGGGGFDWEHAG